MRDLSRAREAAVKDLRGKRQKSPRFMLRLGRHFPGKKTWGRRTSTGSLLQKLEHREQRIALEELLGAVRQESERVERLEQAIRDAVPEWSLAEVVTALQAMRGIDLVAAVTVLAEIGDLSRFENPRELMGYLGLYPPKARQETRSNAVASPRLATACTADAYRSCMELSVSSTCQPREADQGGGRTDGRCARLPGKRK